MPADLSPAPPTADSLLCLSEPGAAYIHVPFCAHRCGYCDFTLIAGRDDLIGAYLQALEQELAGLGTPRPVETLFMGGGTPTHLSAKELDTLLLLVRRWFLLASGGEFSVEGNPAGLDRERVEVLADHGVNRVSLGAQSFEPDVLRFLERDHDAAQIEKAVDELRRRIENISLDLIFGVPGQSLDLWRETLRRAVELEPRHLSTYGLTFERGTAFWGRRLRGEIVPVQDELERNQYAAAMDDLAEAGFEQYELSNLARRGFRCRHNETYWAALPYYGFGPGAARYMRGRRETNHRSVYTWLKRLHSGQSAVGEAEELSPEDRAREAIVLGLRRNDGVNRETFRRTTGFDFDQLAEEKLRRLCERELMEDAGANVCLTRAGRFLADSVIVEFL